MIYYNGFKINASTTCCVVSKINYPVVTILKSARLNNREFIEYAKDYIDFHYKNLIEKFISHATSILVQKCNGQYQRNK